MQLLVEMTTDDIALSHIRVVLYSHIVLEILNVTNSKCINIVHVIKIRD